MFGFVGASQTGGVVVIVLIFQVSKVAVLAINKSKPKSRLISGNCKGFCFKELVLEILFVVIPFLSQIFGGNIAPTRKNNWSTTADSTAAKSHV
jgi:hypothetical protein